MKHLIILLFLSFQIYAQTAHLKGVIQGNEGQVIAYATIKIENTQLIMSANDKGVFDLQGNFNTDDYMVISHIGFETLKIKLNTLDLSIVNKFTLISKPMVSQTVFVEGNIGKEGKTPMAFSKITRASIKETYTDQDIPQFLNLTPSTNFYSENGNGLGYNYLCIRGFDQRRISVSINGIPQNDPEDHNVYWLDFPDLLESSELIQIQRGAGNGLVGYPAIGGSVNIITSTFADTPGLEFSSSIGSYNTRKYSAAFSSGLIDNKYSVYVKLSKTLSSGYRNLSWVDFNAYHISIARYDDDITTQFNFYGGPIKDGLAYTGLPKFAINDRSLRKLNYSYWETDNKNFTYITERKPEEMEEFSQPHFELLNDIKLSDKVKLNSALFLVIGDGYFNYDGSWGDTTYYRLTKLNGFNALQNPTNVLIQAMVNNTQWGWIPRLDISHTNGELILGGELRIHRSLHWGSLAYGENLPVGITPDYRYYQYHGGKDIFAVYANENYSFSEKLNIQIETQLAYHNYLFYDEKYLNNDFRVSDLFFNPRFGINYKLTPALNAYISYANISREPTLQNYYNADESSGGEVPQFEKDSNGKHDFSKPIVKPETMHDFELGINYYSESISLSANGFYMFFNNEIVKNGTVDQFGQPVTGNMEKTLHYGIELSVNIKPVSGLELILNSTLSDNYISSGKTFITYTNPVDLSSEVKELDLSGNTICGFSDFMLGGVIRYKTGNFLVQADMKYMGKFYSDNYGDNLTKYRQLYLGITDYSDNVIDPYFVANIFASYDFKTNLFFNNIKMYIQINNVFDNLYAANAIGGEFFPAAERNILFGLKFGL